MPVNSGISQNVDARYPDSIGTEALSIALIGPDDEKRGILANALAECRGANVREFSSYPTAIDDVPRLLELYFDVIIIDLDSDLEFALDLVENICAKDAATVMVYSTMADQDLVVRCMRAGAREYLILPLDQSTVAEALVRASAISRPRPRAAKRAIGRSLVFLGAKGGSGVTTIACNFAIALAQESGQSTLLVDLALPMGDAALNLGIAAEYSTDHALQDPERLDASFLHKILAKHQSGVSVLAAPSKVPEVEASKEAIDKLMSVARQEFDNVVVDVGSRIDLMGTTLFREASTIYLVTQAGISELRNSNRLISRFFHETGPKLEIIINRFEAGFLGVTEEVITKAISRPVRWKIPDDYDATRQMQNASNGLSLSDSPISRLILEMAGSVTGLPLQQEKKKGFTFKGFGRGGTEKPISITPERPVERPVERSSERPIERSVERPVERPVERRVVERPAPPSVPPSAPGEPASVEWYAPEPIAYGTRLSAEQLNAAASAPGRFVYTPGPGYLLPAGTHTLWVTFTPEDTTDENPVQSSVSITVAKGTPQIDWPEPDEMACGEALSAAQLNATSSVAGNFEYSPAAGEVLSAGTHTLSVFFTPRDQANYTEAEATVSVSVARSVPEIEWAAPDSIVCGTPLSAEQLNAVSSVTGSFDYSPALGEVLSAGTHTLSVTFYPADETIYMQAQASVTLTVDRATPAIAWSSPEKITYGSPLSTAQLNATASVPGTFVYTPSLGAVLAAGDHTPSVIFTPSNGSDYTQAQAAVMLTVAKAMPSITWAAPDPISHGTALSAKQLNATASIPGTLAYAPALGEILPPGAHTLSVSFTPTDSVNYTRAQATVSLTVTEIEQTYIEWPVPSPISYGTPLSEAQLNANASARGSFVYSPALGDVLAPGKHKLSVNFTPEDPERHAPAQAMVSLLVEGLPNVASLLKAAQTSLGYSAPIADADRKPTTFNGGQGAPKVQQETRTYKGATYVKGEDGKWHLQQK
ncbi:MAG TPA: AAA family ATPase [Terracidiphilus sp.]|nr:AAA family ATPase [Terracidiphilus sp.]